MNLQQLKQIVNEVIAQSFQEINHDKTKGGKDIFAVGAPGSRKRNAAIADPSKEEMLNFLKTQFGTEPGWLDDAEVAMYWFANHYHGGQSSNLYSVLSTSAFEPGPISRGPEPGSMEEMMYQALEQQYGGVQEDLGAVPMEEAEMVDPDSGEVAPGPRDRFEMQPGGDKKGEWKAIWGDRPVLKYIDNGFYELTPQQAKEFAVGNQLPGPGRARKADISKLKHALADVHHHIEPLDITDEDRAWIQQTTTWGKRVWAVMIYRRPSFREQGGGGGGGGAGGGGAGGGSASAGVSAGNTTSAVQGYSTPFWARKKRHDEIAINPEFQPNSGKYTGNGHAMSPQEKKEYEEALEFMVNAFQHEQNREERDHYLYLIGILKQKLGIK